MSFRKLSSTVLIVGTLNPGLCCACDCDCAKNSKDSKTKKDSSYASRILGAIGFAVGTFTALSSEELNKSADDLNDEIFGVTRRGYILHRSKASFIVPTANVLVLGTIGRLIGALFGKLFF